MSKDKDLVKVEGEDLLRKGEVVKKEIICMDWATPQEILLQVNLIQEVMRLVMKEGEHYGVIPGFKSKKPSLLKPGAEKLILTFKLVPVVEQEEKDIYHPTIKGHKEYISNVKLYTQGGLYLGCGVGSCSTMEGKYRFQKAEVEITDLPVPGSYWGLRNKDPEGASNLLGGKGFFPHKLDDGRWVVAIVKKDKIENVNPADDYNTCRKISKKRGLIDAVLTVTGASDIFTQDIEDIAENLAKQVVFKEEPVAKTPEQDVVTMVEKIVEKDVVTIMERDDVPPEEYPEGYFGDESINDTKTEPVEYITPPQSKLIHRLINDGRMEEVLFRKYMEERYGYISTKDLTKQQASEVIRHLLSLKPKKEEEKEE